MRRSVLVYLTCLAVVPVVGFVVIATTVVTASREQVASARRVEAAVVALHALDDLRVAMSREAREWIGKNVIARRAALPPLAQPPGMSSTESHRAATDAVLARLAGESGGSEAATTFRRGLQAIRAAASPSPRRSTISTSADRDSVMQQYIRAIDEAESLEIAATVALAKGRFGNLDSRSAEAVSQLTIMTLLVTHAAAASDALVLSGITGASEETPAGGFIPANSAYRALTSTLAPRLDGVLAARWSASAGPHLADQLDGLANKTGQASLPITPDGVRQASVLVRSIDAMQVELMALAVQDVVAAAKSARDDAVRHERLVALGAGALGLVMVLLVITIGGGLRRRLHRLAKAAQDLSSGTFRTVQISGPREVALAGAGLNDAAVNLERVLAGAERLAAGDLSAAEHGAPLEGRLGAAVYASFEQLRTVMEQRERLQTELAHAASHDPLTGLPNRAVAEQLLTAAVERAATGRGSSAVLFVDLDHFKPVNDTYGHMAGDHLLQVVAGRLSKHLRKDDSVCRIGGDEFVVVMRGSRDDADAAGARIVAAVEEPVVWNGHELAVGASVGIAMCEDGTRSPDELMILADHAVYRAKAEGRGTFRS
jgi:diguanylate cyclase (GGDEF)-like protein